MDRLDFINAPFSIGWHFYAKDYSRYPDIYNPPKCFYEDLRVILELGEKHQLFIPISMSFDVKQEVSLENMSIDEISHQIRKLVKNRELTGEIFAITGYGYVINELGDLVKSRDLITINSYRVIQRSFIISTRKTIWSPISISLPKGGSYDFSWQVELAENNASRLETFLNELHFNLGIEVSPEPDELDKEEMLWMKGFKVYPATDLLLNELEENPPTIEDFKVEKYIPG